MRRYAGIVGVVVMLAASGCLGSGRTGRPAPDVSARSARPAAAPTGRMAVVVRLGLRTTRMPATRRYVLTCGPAGGTMPHAAAACSAIGDYPGRGRPGAACFGSEMPPTAATTLVGTFRRHRLRLAINPDLWCGQTRPVMRDLWTLSTFPCSTIVMHTQNIRPYARFARVTGCARVAA
jgi:hypothetical protein